MEENVTSLRPKKDFIKRKKKDKKLRLTNR